MKYRRIIHTESGRVLVERARWCDSFLSKLKGFAFERSLARDAGLVLVEKEDNKINSSVTMFFTFFDLGVIWVNDAGEVVDKVLARSWRPSYVPQAPARFAVEVHPEKLAEVEPGDHLEFVALQAA